MFLASTKQETGLAPSQSEYLGKKKDLYPMLGIEI
jgi:hypothetical protein